MALKIQKVSIFKTRVSSAIEYLARCLGDCVISLYTTVAPS